jgi:hypothetical protein
MNYLLLHCEIARALWNAIFSLVGLDMPRRVIHLFACCGGLCGSFQSEDDSILPNVSLAEKEMIEV